MLKMSPPALGSVVDMVGSVVVVSARCRPVTDAREGGIGQADEDDAPLVPGAPVGPALRGGSKPREDKLFEPQILW